MRYPCKFSAICLAVFQFVLASAWALNPSLPPGQNFDLSQYKWQSPVADGSGVLEISQPQLATYTSAYFYTTNDGAMVFWCPVNGATTSGTSYPRSELRDLREWPLSSTQIMNATCKVLQSPSTGKTIIGQIHGNISGTEAMKLRYSGGDVTAGCKPDLGGTEFQIPILTGVALGTTINYTIKMVNHMVTITVNGVTVTNVLNSTWDAETAYYFKAGTYPQDNSGTSTEGSRIAFYALNNDFAPVSNVVPSVTLTAPANGASFTAPASIAMTATATDSDGTITTVGFYNGTTLLGSDTSSPYAYTWTNVAQGSYNLTARATDNSGAVSTSAVATVTVNAANAAPVFTVDPISKAGATEDVAYTGQTLSGSATDANGDTLTYSAVAGPSWLSIASSGALSGTPANADVGNNSWSVQVSDGKGGTDTAILNITVANVNDAPVFTADPMSKANATEDAAYTGQTLAGSATDVDAGSVQSYSKVSGPAWLTVAIDGTLSGTPANADVGVNSWTVQVSDGNSTDTAVLNITVINVNDAPVFTVDPMSRAGATAGTAYTGQTLAGSATDVDAGSVQSYSKVSGPAWLVVATSGALSGTPAAGDVGTNSWTVQVSDGLGGTDTAVLNITVAAAANNPPVFTVDPMSRANATNGSAYTGQTLSGSATDPDAGATLTYSKVSGPTWLSVATSGALTGTPASTNVGANSWTVQVSDGLGGIDTAVLNITVGAATVQTLTNTFVSVGAEDGWVLESSETSEIGGTSNSTAATTSALRIGDDASKKQYRTVVSFDTSALPDGATILSATLKLKRGTISNVTTNLGTILVDIKNGTGFNGAVALTKQDFEAAADATGVATMSYPASNGTWSTGALNAAGLAQLNKTGKTQLKVRYSTPDDNDTTADYLGFYSGENSTTANRPVLEVIYQ